MGRIPYTGHCTPPVVRTDLSTCSTMPALLFATLGMTRPGQSQSVMSSVRGNVWKCFVLPGVSDTRTFYNISVERDFFVGNFFFSQTFEDKSLFIVELLPTFGYPIHPTVMLSIS